MKILIDFFPILLFFGAYKFYGIYAGTAVLMAATVVQMGLIFAIDRRLQTMHKVTLVLILLFGTLTLVLQDDRFIKWKPTALYWMFAAVLAGSTVVFRRNLIRKMLETQIRLPDAVWARLNVAWAAFFALMGVLNLYVAYSFSEEFWVNFKLFGGMGLMFAFVLAQGFYLSRHLEEENN